LKTFQEFINESGDYYDNLYKNGKLTITYTYKQLGLDKIVEKFHKETGIPRQFIIDEFCYNITMYSEQEVPDYFYHNYESFSGIIQDNWNELDDEEKKELEAVDKFRSKII
jgi:hypothetical protein